MERKDLLEANAASFLSGKALNDNASRGVKVLVVGNPANTNGLIAQRNAPDLDPRNYCHDSTDHNRAMAQLAQRPANMLAMLTVCAFGATIQLLSIRISIARALAVLMPCRG